MKNQIKSIAKKHKVNVEWIDHSIGFREENTIYLNKNLLKYPNYCERIFYHELNHSKSYNWNDVLMDMVEPNTIENLRFCIKHPKGFACLLPIMYFKGHWSFDITTLSFYLLFLFVLTIYVVMIFGL